MDYEKKGAQVVYKNVQQDKSAMAEMLTVCKGRRDVPAIVEGDKVTIGYGGT
ncbi:MAG: glutaredoxin family protein [Deltaproteobacteria bacterium]|nr:glutaredoxin family protein [Deltaproteobacteria bacterium]